VAGSWKPLIFLLRSVIVGLAAAFVVVLLRPGLITNRPGADDAGYAGAVAASSPAVVTIYTAQIVEPRPGRGAVPVVGRGLGSGVIFSPDGYIVTNWHVIKDADAIRIQLADGRVAAADIVGADPETELALLRTSLPDLPVIALGRSDTLRIGEVALAIGNSFGLSQTVTQGIVSATGRGQLGVALFENFIQTDAAINIGNSGGALINIRGELIGINTAVINAIARDQAVIPDGIGFAIPVNLVRGVVDELIAHGRVIRGWLGVDPRSLSAERARQLGLPGTGIELAGVSGPAAVAGLQPGDVITHIDNETILNPRQAMNLVASAKPGQRIKIRGFRAGKDFQVEAVLEERPPSPGIRRPS
jgi:serine peptidase DegS